MVAAIPDANAIAAAPPSICAMADSRARRLGFASRIYAYPDGNDPSGARSNVVERWIGDATAPVAGSGSAPACTATVSKRTDCVPRGWSQSTILHADVNY